MISITPLGGLCNRMRALDSAVCLAKAIGTEVHVCWELSDELNCPFDELFDAIPQVAHIREMSCFGKRAKLSRVVGEFVHKVHGADVVTQREVESLMNAPDVWLARASAKTLHIRTHSRFFNGEQDFSCFRLAPPLGRLVEAYRPRLAKSVGVHIRTTDNVMSLQHSPLAAFQALMRREVVEQPETEFFVATDSPEAMEALISEFGGRVWMHPKRAYARSEPDAIRDAAVDLFCLAACNKLIGSYWSSFTDTAAALSGGPLTIASAEALAGGA